MMLLDLLYWRLCRWGVGLWAGTSAQIFKEKEERVCLCLFVDQIFTSSVEDYLPAVKPAKGFKSNYLRVFFRLTAERCSHMVRLMYTVYVCHTVLWQCECLIKAAAGVADCGEALPAHSVCLFVWKAITLSNLDFFIGNIMYSFQGVVIQGHVDFWFPPSEEFILKLCLKVKTKHTHTKKPLLICFSTSWLPIPFQQESIFLSLCCQGLMRLSGHTCALRKIPLLSVKLYYSAQGHDSQCF